jgi:hypothetical protein
MLLYVMAPKYTTVRIDREHLQRLQSIAEHRGKRQSALLAELIDEADEQDFWDRFDSGWDSVKADPKLWRQVQDEQRLWDNTLMDGLEDAE